MTTAISSETCSTISLLIILYLLLRIEACAVLEVAVIIASCRRLRRRARLSLQIYGLTVAMLAENAEPGKAGLDAHYPVKRQPVNVNFNLDFCEKNPTIAS